MLGGEVDVLLHVLRRSTVAAVGLHLFIVRHTEFHAGHGIGVAPCALARDHLPPYSYIFSRVNPAGVGDFRGLVEI